MTQFSTILFLFPFLLSEDDFSAHLIVIEVPASSQSIEIPMFSVIEDDNFDEYEESFAVVAEIDVPEHIGCFQIPVGSTGCLGRRGATEIRVSDNDRMLNFKRVCGRI